MFCFHLQIISTTENASNFYLCEDRVPLLKERSEVKRTAQERPLAPEEEVIRVVSGWNSDEGYVGRICLKTKDEVCLQNM